MKKYLSFALAAALSAAFCATAFAAEDNRQVEVKTHIDPTYTVTIPADTKVISKAEDTSFGAITLTAAQLDPGKSVNVTLKSSGTLKTRTTQAKCSPIRSAAAKARLHPPAIKRQGKARP